MSLLESPTDVVQVHVVGVTDPVEVKSRVQPLQAASLPGAAEASTPRYRSISRSWPDGVTDWVAWDGREWDVTGEPQHRYGSEVTRHVTVLLQPRDVDDVTIVTPTTSTDAYGNTTTDYGVGASRVTVKGRVQPADTDEDAVGTAGRGRVATEYVVSLPAAAPVTSESRLEWSGLVLDVVGDPQVRRGVVSPRPVEVRARLVRG